jgi:Fe-S oxidoreductase
MISSLLNLVFKDSKAGKRLQGVPADAGPEEIGYTELEDLSWKQLLDLDACTKCGRCTDVCPANASGRPLDPRNVILDLKEYRDHLEAGGEEIPIITDSGDSIIDSETMESCLSCMACMDACPVAIEHVPQFTQMNRRLIESGEMNETIQDTMMNIFQKGNSFGDPDRKRGDWSEELDFEITDAREERVDYLWYVGDYPSYDDRQKKVARSLARIFRRSDVDYGILFDDERNDGNDVRRIGEEGLYEMLVEENIESFESCDFNKIVCTDPHSFNTFKHEYPEFGWDEKPVYHYTEVIEELFNEERLDLRGDELDYRVTYHDPCHLGRFNDVYEAPRRLIQATGCELYEMPRNRSNSFCCGGGGGGLWMDFEDDPKPSEERMREALEDTDAGDTIEKFVVACPMCGTMYEDGRKTGGYEDEIEVIDLAELILEAYSVSENGSSTNGEAAVSA